MSVKVAAHEISRCLVKHHLENTKLFVISELAKNINMISFLERSFLVGVIPRIVYEEVE